MGHNQKLLLSEMVFFWNFGKYLGQELSSLKMEKVAGKELHCREMILAIWASKCVR